MTAMMMPIDHGPWDAMGQIVSVLDQITDKDE